MQKSLRITLTIALLLFACNVPAQSIKTAEWIPVAPGWAKNSVNTVVFRKNSLVTHKDTQYIAYYNEERFVVLGKRRIGQKQWQLHQTDFTGHAQDAHNSISIMVDGDGYLHMAWDHHNKPLNYARGQSPGSLELIRSPMTGLHEQQLSYPEFFKMPDGDLLFFYRSGESGRGNLVIDRYDLHTKTWTQVQSNLIDGEGQRNAYWQAYVDQHGVIHLSWVWRETPDVASNHDLCYARSSDAGKTWTTSRGEIYSLPVTASNAEYACRIPEKSELINQTSMYADENGNPYIVTYWRDSLQSVPQIHLVFRKNNKWYVHNLGFRKTSFTLSGAGTKRIPISRPQVIGWRFKRSTALAVIFRDEERQGRVSIAHCRDLNRLKWKLFDLSGENVGSWEPTYDTELWKEKKILNLFVQRTEQVDAEGEADFPPQLVSVLEWKPY